MLLRLVRVKGLPRLTANTLVTKAALLAELQKVRQQGYAIDYQESELEGRCIGAPVAALDGSVVGALSISGPVFRMDLTRARSLAAKLKQVCSAISQAIRSYVGDFGSHNSIRFPSGSMIQPKLPYSCSSTLSST